MNNTTRCFVLSLFSGFLGITLFAQPAVKTTFMSQNFESCSMPSGWRSSSVPSGCNNSWQVGTPSSTSSTYFQISSNGSSCIAVINDDGDSGSCDRSNGDTLFSPAVIISGSRTVMLYLQYYYYDGTYQGDQEDFKLLVSRDSGRTWQVAYDFPKMTQTWDDVILPLNAYLNSSLDDTLMLAFVYYDGGGWLYGAAVDNILLYEPYELEAGLDKLFVPEYVSPGALAPILVTLRNYGSTPISSIILKAHLHKSNANNSTTLTFNTPLQSGRDTIVSLNGLVSTSGVINEVETITITIDSVNGVYPDSFTDNNSLKKTFFVVNELFHRKALCEDFTNSSCGPCAAFNPIFTAFVKSARDTVAPIMYHVWWPQQNDPMYVFDSMNVRTRVSFYNVMGVPAPFTNGEEGFSPSLARYYYLLRSPLELSLHTYYTDSSMTQVEVTVVIKNGNNDMNKFMQYMNITSPKVYVAIGEEAVTYSSPPGTNGEKYFPWVMRTMLPSANGTTYNIPQGNNDSFSISFTYQIDTSVIDRDSVYAIAWIQDANSKYVINALDMPASFKQPGQSDTTTSVHSPYGSSASFHMYITEDKLLIRALHEMTEAQSIFVILPDGKKITTLHTGPINKGFHTIPLNSLSPGYFFIVFEYETGKYHVIPYNKLQ